MTTPREDRVQVLVRLKVRFDVTYNAGNLVHVLVPHDHLGRDLRNRAAQLCPGFEGLVHDHETRRQVLVVHVDQRPIRRLDQRFHRLDVQNHSSDDRRSRHALKLHAVPFDERARRVQAQRGNEIAHCRLRGQTNGQGGRPAKGQHGTNVDPENDQRRHGRADKNGPGQQLRQRLEEAQDLTLIEARRRRVCRLDELPGRQQQLLLNT
mmetsp:Transcript_12203/g.34655  ORF Transcript_12203/g.34655 Transcript_12203/m.34655 type:complete len:208 (+) Transcript_12203:2037-2660(+)